MCLLFKSAFSKGKKAGILLIAMLQTMRAR